MDFKGLIIAGGPVHPAIIEFDEEGWSKSQSIDYLEDLYIRGEITLEQLDRRIGYNLGILNKWTPLG